MLATWMHSDDQATRDEAYGVLGAIKQPWAVPMLLDGLKNEHGEARLQPIVSLGHTGDPAVAAKIVPFVNTQGLVFASLEALGGLGNESSLSAIQPMLEHEQPLVRVYAGTAAWRLGHEDLATPVLEPQVEAEDPVVRRNLAEQLAPIDAPAASQLLVRLSADDDRDVCISALRALSGRSGPEVEAALIAATQSSDYQVASAALDALADTGGAGALAAAKARLDDENPYVEVTAAHAVLTLQAEGASAAG